MKSSGWRKGLWTAEAQAEFIERFTAFLQHPAVVSINYWGSQIGIFDPVPGWWMPSTACRLS
jgi:hypothetical protein